MTEPSTKTAGLECPACGSCEVETSRSRQSYTAPFGDTRVYEVRLDTCRACGESGDFAGTNDEIVKAAIEEADRDSVEAILSELNQAGVTTAYLERALALPARTAARWKAGGSSASGLALLRLVRTYPWLLEVGASRFSAQVARRAVLQAAATVIGEAASDTGYRCSVAMAQPAAGTFEVRASFSQALVPSQTASLDAGNSVALTEERAA